MAIQDVRIYSTGNAVPSRKLEDFYDNCAIRDFLVNDTSGDDVYNRTGDAVLKSWYSLSAEFTAVNLTSVVRYTYTADAVHNFSPDAKAVKIIAVGAGGGAGSVSGVASALGLSLAGGSGAYANSYLSNYDSSVTITIGLGGTGGASGGNGSAGGDTTVVGASIVDITAGGGSGGLGVTSSTGSQYLLGVSGGTANGANLNFGGNPPTVAAQITGSLASVSQSGASIFGGSVRGVIDAVGIDANTFGTGGGATGSTTATSYDGGDGSSGVVLIEEYF